MYCQDRGGTGNILGADRNHSSVEYAAFQHEIMMYDYYHNIRKLFSIEVGSGVTGKMTEKETAD